LLGALGTADGNLALDGIVPYPCGLELQPLVSHLEAFLKPETWSVYLCRAPLCLPDNDVASSNGN
jgi:hypothetical protein